MLGPLVMANGGKSFVPSAPKQRQLLALLLVDANQSVSVDACIEELWENRPPFSARSTLQTYVLHLRRAFSQIPEVGRLAEAKKILQTGDRGYRLVVCDGALDLHTFERLVERARTALAAGDDRKGAALLADALAVWRGPALADVQVGPLLQAHVVGLAEYRLHILEQRIEADLRLGRHHELVRELSALTAQRPTHENLHAQLMLALYRSGRPAQALEAFHRLRHVLSGELGLEPSPRMHRFHQAVLTGDSALETPVSAASPLTLDLSLSAG
ncbi:hypothetical protein GCM10023084_24430 [Streptomyces lacrimifluminis]